jgi:hypothetical protein
MMPDDRCRHASAADDHFFGHGPSQWNTSRDGSPSSLHTACRVIAGQLPVEGVSTARPRSRFARGRTKSRNRRDTRTAAHEKAAVLHPMDFAQHKTWSWRDGSTPAMLVFPEM